MLVHVEQQSIISAIHLQESGILIIGKQAEPRIDHKWTSLQKNQLHSGKKCHNRSRTEERLFLLSSATADSVLALKVLASTCCVRVRSFINVVTVVELWMVQFRACCNQAQESLGCNTQTSRQIQVLQLRYCTMLCKSPAGIIEIAHLRNGIMDDE